MSCECLLIGPQQAGKTLLLNKLQASIQYTHSSSSVPQNNENATRSLLASLTSLNGSKRKGKDTQQDHEKGFSSPFLCSSPSVSNNLYSTSSYVIPTVGVNVVSLAPLTKVSCSSHNSTKSTIKGGSSGVNQEIVIREVGGMYITTNVFGLPS